MKTITHIISLTLLSVITSVVASHASAAEEVSSLEPTATQAPRPLSKILKEHGEVWIRVNRYTHLYLSADQKYQFTTGPHFLSGMSSRGTWKHEGRFILLTGSWQPVNAVSMVVEKSWKLQLGQLTQIPDDPEFYEGWICFEEITPSQPPSAGERESAKSGPKLAPKNEPIDPDELLSALHAKEGFRSHAPKIRRGLVGSQLTYRAESAQWFIQHGTIEDVPYLIDALSDESVHVGAKYPVAGMATTRYWANVALIAICKTSYDYQWDAPKKKREYSISLWKQHWMRIKAKDDEPGEQVRVGKG